MTYALRIRRGEKEREGEEREREREKESERERERKNEKENETHNAPQFTWLRSGGRSLEGVPKHAQNGQTVMSQPHGFLNGA